MAHPPIWIACLSTCPEPSGPQETKTDFQGR